MFDVAFELISEITKLEDGATAYIVGGAVRDYLLGRECHDIDISTSVNIELIENNFDTHNIGKNKDFGIVVVDYKGHIFEISQFRSDGDYTNGRHPDSVKLGVGLYEDSLRRDFTINAMYMGSDGRIIDFHGGRKDLENKFICSVGKSDDRFKEDYLRMIRAIRFASVLDFEIDYQTYRSIIRFSDNITHIAKERVWNELWKMAEGDNFAYGVKLLNDTKLLKYIMPEVSEMFSGKYPHQRKYHPEGGIAEHIMMVLKCLDNQSPIVKLAGLFHDIGKPKAYTIDGGVSHYKKHECIGVEVFDEIVNNVPIPKNIANEIRYTIKNHMKMHHFLEMKDSKCFDLIDSPYWDTLYRVSYADDLSRLYLFDREYWNSIDNKIKRIKDIIARKNSVRDILNGKFVMDILNIEGCSKVGEVLKKAIDYVINNNLDLSSESNVELITKYIRNCK